MAKISKIVKADKVSFTAGRIADFMCPEDKPQSFLWCEDPLGLAIRATNKGVKSYIFQAKVRGQSMRITIGGVSIWSIADAKKEARRLQTEIDQGNDPREVKAEIIAAKIAHSSAQKQKELRETVTLSIAWADYIEARKSTWGTLHLRDHEWAMHAGGKERKRSSKLTSPGILASLAHVRLIDLTPELVTDWAKIEGEKRPTSARKGRTILSTFLNWCSEHPKYKFIVTSNSAMSKEAKKYLGKPKAKNDALQREQLDAWFKAARQIGNPVISAYVQSLLLTGARPNELITLRWQDVDFQWKHMTIRDKVEGLRVIPLTPYVAQLLSGLPRRMLTVRQLGVSSIETAGNVPNEFVFSSPTSESGHLIEPRLSHDTACAVAGVDVTLHGLRRSFASLCEWIEMPAGIGAQIQGHKPQGVREQHYIRRPLDLLRMWHVKIEEWILKEAGIKFVQRKTNLKSVGSKSANK
jgi:integrase